MQPITSQESLKMFSFQIAQDEFTPQADPCSFFIPLLISSPHERQVANSFTTQDACFG
jgi:hypothetical protein